MKTRPAEPRENSEWKVGSLEIKLAHSAQDWRRAKEALGREHGLGAGSEAGDRLCQLVMEEGKLAANMSQETLLGHLRSIIKVISRLLDPDIFVWIPDRREPSTEERRRASTIVADRLTGAAANPVIRNAQEKRKLKEIAGYLVKKGYSRKPHSPGAPMDTMAPGTFTFHYPVVTGNEMYKTNVSVDALIQPHVMRPNRLPIMVEAKSAGDFTNTNKRRKEEAKKFSQLKATYGEDICYVVFLCGYFDSGYLGYEAADGIDWVWEHRITDFEQLGV